MVTDTLINIVFLIINTILSPLERLSFNFDITKLEPILQYIRMAMYIIPFAQLSPIFVFFVGMMAFRIMVSIIKTIWDLLPVL